MRVVHVAPTAFGRAGLFGGGERYPVELARAVAREVDCELITFGRAAGRSRERGGLRVRTLRAHGLLHGHPAHPLAPALAPALRDADIVHVHQLHAVPSRIGVVTARLLGRRAVTTDHGLSGGAWGGLLRRVVHRFLLVSAYSARQLQAPPARTRLIYGGADPRRFAPDPTVRREGVLFVGRLTPHKGVDRLIEALPEGARLLVAGSTGHDPRPPERDYPRLLRRLAAGRTVEWLLPATDALLPSLYRQAAVVVLPSVHRTCYGRTVQTSELLGLVVLEAMASGTPVIASRLGGVPEVVEDGRTGFLVEPGNVAELRERIAQLLRDPGLAARLGRNGRERAVDRFTWEKVAGRCLAAYTELLRPAASASTRSPPRGVSTRA